MGGVWRSADTVSYASYSSVNSTKSVDQVFVSRNMDPSLDPKKIELRECVDSEECPNSTAMLIGVDVTGSMGYLAKEIAVNGLGKLIKGIYDDKPVSDPNIAFCAIGDHAARDEAPLQISQFEGDMRIVTELQKIYVEGGGGGNRTEGYELPWIFAAERTKIDCFDKRGEKGFIFTIGDEPAPHGVSTDQYSAVFGGKQSARYTPRQALEAAQQQWEVFHIILMESDWVRHYRSEVEDSWRELLGHRVLMLDNHKNLPEVVLAAVRVARGEEPEAVIAAQNDEEIKTSIRTALGI